MVGQVTSHVLTWPRQQHAMVLIHYLNPCWLSEGPVPPAAAEAAEDEHGAGLLQHTCKTTTPSGEMISHVAPWTQHASNFDLLFSFHSTFPLKRTLILISPRIPLWFTFKSDIKEKKTKNPDRWRRDKMLMGNWSNKLGDPDQPFIIQWSCTPGCLVRAQPSSQLSIKQYHIALMLTLQKSV